MGGSMEGEREGGEGKEGGMVGKEAGRKGMEGEGEGRWLLDKLAGRQGGRQVGPLVGG